MISPNAFNRSLTYLLLFLLHLSPIAAYASPEPFTKIVPPPLPNEEWVNKSSIDYALKHEQYADLLVCLWIPLGTIGSMVWFTIFVATIYGILAALICKNQKHDWFSIVQAVITIAWAIYALVQVFLTIRDCKDLPQFNLIRSVVIVLIVSEVFNIISAVLVRFDRKGKLAIGVSCFTILLMWISALIALKHVADQQPGNSQPNFIAESVSLNAKVPAIVVWILTSIGGLVLGIKIARKRDPRSIFIGIFCSCLFLVVAVFIGIFGFTFVYLGNIIGSPWGTYYLTNWYGQLTGGLTALVAVAEIIVLGLLVFNAGEDIVGIHMTTPDQEYSAVTTKERELHEP